MDIDPLIDLTTVMCMTGISKSYTYALIARREFPVQVKVGRASRWVSSEVWTWVTERIGERDSNPS